MNFFARHYRKLMALLVVETIVVGLVAGGAIANAATDGQVLCNLAAGANIDVSASKQCDNAKGSVGRDPTEWSSGDYAHSVQKNGPMTTSHSSSSNTSYSTSNSSSNYSTGSSQSNGTLPNESYQYGFNNPNRYNGYGATNTNGSGSTNNTGSSTNPNTTNNSNNSSNNNSTQSQSCTQPNNSSSDSNVNGKSSSS